MNVGLSVLSSLGEKIVSGSPKPPRPLPEMDLDQLSRNHNDWVVAANVAALCTGAVMDAAGRSIGSGILVGKNLLVLPMHLIEDGCASHFSVCFHDLQGQKHSFTFAEFLEDNRELDYRIVQLNPRPDQVHAGDLVPIPEIALAPSKELLLSQRNEDGEMAFSLSRSSRGPNANTKLGFAYCSTREGWSGSCYFDQTGKVYSMHLGRSKGNHSPKLRFAIPLNEVLEKSSVLQHNLRHEVAAAVPKSSCRTPIQSAPYVLEGKKHNEIYYDENLVVIDLKTTATFYAKFFEHKVDGRGPRWALVNIYEKDQKNWKIICDKVQVPLGQVHDEHKYNKNPRPFYYKAADTYFREYMKNRANLSTNSSSKSASGSKITSGKKKRS